VLDATDEDLGAGIVESPELHDEGALGRQRRVAHRAGTSQEVLIFLHETPTSARRPARSVRNAETFRKARIRVDRSGRVSSTTIDFPPFRLDLRAEQLTRDGTPVCTE